MPQFPFVGDAYKARSVNVNGSQAINLFPEIEPSGKTVLALYGTPGSVSRGTFATGAEVRAAFNYDGVAYFVCGNKLYSMTTAYVLTELGTLTTSSGYVSIATNGLVLLIVDGTDGYTFTFVGSVFATISDIDFPPNPDRCDLLDNTFIVIEGGTQRFWTSINGTDWDSAAFASAETQPDNLISLIVDHQEIILGGSETTEVWYNSGDAVFTFSRRSTIETGVASPGSMCKADNSVFFLGNDKVVWRLDGYSPRRVSTHAIEYAINQYTTVSDCIMWTQKEEGHLFIWLAFPTGNETWVYDVASEMWHRRAWRNPATGVLNRHRANCYTYFNKKHFVGDYDNGNILELSLDIYDDNGDPLPAIRVCTPLSTATSDQTLHHNYLIIDMEAGVGLTNGDDPLMMLKWSSNNGHTYGNEIFRSIGKVGEYKVQARWNKLGRIRYPAARTYWAEISDPVKRVILGADLGVSK